MNPQIHQIMAAMNAELNPEFYSGLTKLFHSLRISLPRFHEDVDYGYLNYIYENVSKKRCDLIMYSKLGKYKVDLFLKEKKVSREKPEHKPNSIFFGFLNDLHEASKDFKDQIFPFAGKENLVSFSSVYESSSLVNAGYTAKAVKETLIESGCLEQVDKKRLKFISSIPKPLNSDIDTIHQLSDLMLHYTSTVLHNRNTPDDNKKHFERFINSELIQSEHSDVCLTELRDHFKPVLTKGLKIIESHETKGAKSTHDVGFHIFLYKSEKEN